MPIKFHCPRCKKELTVKDEMAGKQGKCPACKSAITVPSASAVSAKTAPKKKPDDDDVVAAEVVDDDVVEAAEVVDEDDDRPRKKSSRRDDDDDDDRPRKKTSRRDDDDDDDGRPRKKASRRDDDDDDDDRPKKKSSVRDDDDDDDRPRKKSSRRKDDDDEEETKKESPKKRRAAFKRASLGVFLSWIGTLIYAGAIVLSVIAFFIVMASASSRAGFGSGGGAFIKILGYLCGLALIANFVLSVVGSSFLITTPGRRGELGLGIATLSTAGVMLLLFLFAVIKLFDVEFSTIIFMPFILMNPMVELGKETPLLLIMMVLPLPSALFYLLPLAEMGRLSVFSFYQCAVAKSNKDPDGAKQHFMMGILVPCAIFGVGLLDFLICLALKKSTTHWPFTILITLTQLAMAGLIIWYALGMMTTRSNLEDQS